ncbi:MAG: extracellular solute-binding protein [Butyrivibrio sp.]|nr:extracellular solute-binding protein [Butyrivibrio sp.]
MKKKKIAIMLVPAIITAALVGYECWYLSVTDNNSFLGNSAEKKANADDLQVVTVWSDNAHEQTIREAQIEEYNNTVGKEEGICIEYKVFGTEYGDAIDAAFINGEGPDLFRPSSNTFARYVEEGNAVPISDLEGSDSFLSLYNKDDLAIGDQIFYDKIYTLPYSLQSYKMIINKDLFDMAGIAEPPATWNEVREDAKVITEKSGGEAYGFFLALESGWTLDHYIYSVSSASLGHFGYDAVSGTYRYSDGLPIIKNILGMIEDGSVYPGYENMDADKARAEFSAGKVGIAMAASFDVAVYTEQFPAKCKWIVCDPPSITSAGYKYKEMVTATDLLAVSKKALDAKDTSKIARVLEWFYSDDNLVKMYEQGMYIPYRNEVLEKAKESFVPGWKEFATFKDGQFIIRMADPKGVIDIEGLSARDTLAKLLAGEYSEDPEEVLNDLDKRLNKGLTKLDDVILREYIAPATYSVERVAIQR